MGRVMGKVGIKVGIKVSIKISIKVGIKVLFGTRQRSSKRPVKWVCCFSLRGRRVQVGTRIRAELEQN